MGNPDLGSNLVQIFERSVERRGDAPFLWQKLDGVWQPRSWRRVADDVDALARCLAAHGVSPGDRVLLVAESRPEWCSADLAILTAGAVTVPAYTTNTTADHAYLIEHAETKAVVFGGGTIARRLLPAISSEGSVRLLIHLDQPDGEMPAGVRALSWQDAVAQGKGAAPVQAGRSARSSDLACFIYTSGTGGRPKGVMLSHANIIANIAGAIELLEEIGLGDEVFLSFLPLSHAYEHTAGQMLPIAIGAQIYYAEGVEKLAGNLAETRPTIVTCVPRLFEVLRQRILNGVEREGGIKAKLFAKAVELGRRRYENGGRLSLPDRLADLLLDRVVRAKVSQRFGGRLKAMVSGGAPLNPDVGRFFLALGVPLLQGYGQTEASPVISVNRPKYNKIETVGPPLSGVEVRIAEDGEILVRGKLVMRGYWKDADTTAATLRDGWLHTGDIGLLDEDGYLRIVDRKKDIIVNSGGDNIAPQRVEGVLELEPEISQALVYGDRKPHLVALIVPSQELLKQAAQARSGKNGTDLRIDELPAIRDAVSRAVKKANERLSVVERVRRYELLAEPFSIENGLMTPTLKLKRAQICARYRETLEKLYTTK